MTRLIVHGAAVAVLAAPLLSPPVAAQPAPYGPPVVLQPSRPDFDVTGTADGRYLVVAAVAAAGTDRYTLFGQVFSTSGRGEPPVTLVPADALGDFVEPAVTVGAGGTWILTWSRSEEVRGQLFAPDGTARNPPFTVFSGRVGLEGPEVCSDEAGGFVVASEVFMSGAPGYETHLRRFDAAARPVGSERVVANASGPALACAADGRFVVVTESFVEGGRRTYLARYGADGELLEAPQVVPGASGARVAMTPAGEIAVMWGERDRPPSILFVDAAGRLGSPRWLTAPPGTVWPGDLDVVAGADGTFTAVWCSTEEERPEDLGGAATVISVRSFAAAGRPLGPRRTLTEIWSNDQPTPLRLALDNAGHLALVWTLQELGAQFFSGAGPGVLEFERLPAVADEDDRTVTVRVGRRAGSTGAVTVDVVAVPVVTGLGAAAPGVARAGEDFWAPRATVRFEPDDSRPRSVSVALLDDPAVEGRETFRLRLASPTGGATAGRRATIAVEIRDDDEGWPLAPRGVPLAVSVGAGPRNESPVVAVGPDGGFAVAWSTPSDANEVSSSDGSSVLARRFDRGGRPLEPPLVVEDRFLPTLAVDGGGNFSLLHQETFIGSRDLAIRLYLQTAAAGEGWRAPLLIHVGPEWFRGFGPGRIAHARTAEGGYVLGGPLDAGGGFQVLSLDGDGRPLGPVVTVHGFADQPAFALRAPGSSVALWRVPFDGSGWGLVSRPLDLMADGSVASAETLALNRQWLGLQTRPAVAVLKSGRYLAVWQTRDEAAGRWRIAGRLLDAGGRPVGGDLAVSADADRDSRAPAVAALATGGAVVVWESAAEDPASTVRAQALDTAGRAVGAAWRVDGSPPEDGVTGDRRRPAVASNRAGMVVVVWQRTSADGDRSEIYGQRYRPRR